MAEKEQETGKADEGKAKGGRKGIIIVVIVLQVLILGAVAWLFLRPHDTKPAATAQTKTEGKAKEAAAEDPNAAPIYLPFKPPFVVNVRAGNGRMRFLQVSVEVMSHQQAPIKAARDNMPLIRNNLLLLFGSQTLADVISLDGKQKLREAALAEVRKILKDNHQPDGIDALYFSSFVVQ